MARSSNAFTIGLFKRVQAMKPRILLPSCLAAPVSRARIGEMKHTPLSLARAVARRSRCLSAGWRTGVVLAALCLGALLPTGRACTLWGAAGADAGGGTIVSKNRDWAPDHVQVLKISRPAKGHAYFGLYAQGNNAPGIKQGVNEKGLAVMTADAGSLPKKIRDAQPGRGGLMTTLLTGYASCAEVLAAKDTLFTNRRPVFMLIADRRQILVLEIGLHGRYTLESVTSGPVVHANHFLNPAMREFNHRIGKSSAARAQRITELLQQKPPPYDAACFAEMSRDRQNAPDNSLWRDGQGSHTLSSWIVESPAVGPPRLRVTIANPGQVEVTHHLVLDDHFWQQSPAPFAFHAAACDGAYPRHLQGICTNERDALYWSWTDVLLKTDLNGRALQRVPVANHHGDLCFHEDQVYVAVNLGKFNQPPGQADSWIFVYDAGTLAEHARHPVPELVHGAGGVAYREGKFFVVGGLPADATENYVYEYDRQFQFQKRHTLASGYTLMGIQTVAFANGSWWFGCYGNPRVVLRADPGFQLTGRWDFDASLGIIGLPDGRLLIGQNTRKKEVGHEGRAVLARADDADGLVFE